LIRPSVGVNSIHHPKSNCHHPIVASGDEGPRLIGELKRRRQTWLDLAAHGFEEAGHGRGTAGLTAETIKQREKRKQDAAKNAALGIEKFSV